MPGPELDQSGGSREFWEEKGYLMTANRNRKLISTLLIVVAITLLYPIYHAPVWWVSLNAPNYPKESFPKGRFSILAGYVDPGESLEEAVAREVREETGVSVTDVQYQASQPWPFPSSLMLGFRARATSEEITCDEEEIEEAYWFSREDLRQFPEKGYQLSRPDSIARCLIDEWLNEAD